MDAQRVTDTAAADAGTRPSIFSFYRGVIWQPRTAFAELLLDRRRLKLALIALLLTTQLYTLIYLLLLFARAHNAPVQTWVDLPVASYFRFEDLAATPSIFAGWILAAGLTQFLTRVVKGKGTFEGMLATLAFAISVGSLPVLLLDLSQSALYASGLIDPQRLSALAHAPGPWHEALMLFYALSITWTATLFCIAVRAVQGLHLSAGAIVGILGYLAYASVFAFINR